VQTCAFLQGDLKNFSRIFCQDSQWCATLPPHTILHGTEWVQKHGSSLSSRWSGYISHKKLGPKFFLSSAKTEHSKCHSSSSTSTQANTTQHPPVCLFTVLHTGKY